MIYPDFYENDIFFVNLVKSNKEFFYIDLKNISEYRRINKDNIYLSFKYKRGKEFGDISAPNSSIYYNLVVL